MLSFNTADGETWTFGRVVPQRGWTEFGTARRAHGGAVIVSLVECRCVPASFFDKLNRGLARIGGGAAESFSVEGVSPPDALCHAEPGSG